jgi:hypothetical protein
MVSLYHILDVSLIVRWNANWTSIYVQFLRSFIDKTGRPVDIHEKYLVKIMNIFYQSIEIEQL